VQYESHKYSQAEQAFRHALGLNKSLFVPNLFVGLDLLELKRPREAIGYLLATEKLNPQDTEVLIALGRAYHTILDSGRSREWYQKAADLAPRNGEAWYGLGMAYLELAELASAKLMAEFPQSPYVAELRAGASRQQLAGLRAPRRLPVCATKTSMRSRKNCGRTQSWVSRHWSAPENWNPIRRECMPCSEMCTSSGKCFAKPRTSTPKCSRSSRIMLRVWPD